ncbi:TlpA disulfide reductase family protein [Telluribacter sp. SYSU D00476]|uniref:TlpA family protein disulfide reductase n=1 Tax=Telluribacter sp. SYSU D00476 TaxID=2811430 RepID=UPI001FF6618C|nr:TlpA disulfide reductase family protein [Telluribacter sp. SYSU D00476]
MKTAVDKVKSFIGKVPEWVVILVVFGFLYVTGLHTPIIGHIQRLILATGLMNPALPETTEMEAANAAAYPQTGYPFTMSTLDGKTVTLESLRGKVVFLNQWATWCPPCRAEMPAIEKLYQSMDKDKVAFVMLSLDEDPAKAERYIRQAEFSFPVYVPASTIPPEFRSQAIPTTLILDPRGQLVHRIEGMANYDTDEFRQYLKDLYR